MSFELEIAPDARSQWRELEVELQELVLDELDRRAAEVLPPGPVLVDFTHQRAGVKHYVFLSMLVGRGVLTVLGVSHFARPIDPPAG